MDSITILISEKPLTTWARYKLNEAKRELKLNHELEIVRFSKTPSTEEWMMQLYGKYRQEIQQYLGNH